MCMQVSGVRPYQRWHWAGDEIVHEPIIPASRKVPGSSKTRYDIDIREFLSIEANAVIGKNLRRLVSKLSAIEKEHFQSRNKGDFDFRARKVAEFIGRLRYEGHDRAAKEWLFPEETLANGGGDCEDFAFLLASMLEASGISPYCLRVALGVIINHAASVPKGERYYHAWVMYFNEHGVWQILEPMALPNEELRYRISGIKTRRVRTDDTPDIEYVPHFVFNRHHLWNVRTYENDVQKPFKTYLDDRSGFWREFDPRFAAGVHADIFDMALMGMPWPSLLEVKAVSLAVDVNVINYSPLDHFDTAYIDEAWAQVDKRLAKGKLREFALAVHAIGDFYAHSLYGEFARWRDETSIVPLYDRENPEYAKPLKYDFNRLVPLPGCDAGTSPAAASNLWKNKMISGQWLRWYAAFPKKLKRRQDFPKRLCLPDHDAVAVDGPQARPSHKLYTDPEEYKRQFGARREAAIEHIKTVYDNWIGRDS